MNTMIAASLVLNIAILIPVCSGLITGAAWVDEVYGAASPARSILTALYLAVAILSALLLVWMQPQAVVALLMLQVVYKDRKSVV